MKQPTHRQIRIYIDGLLTAVPYALSRMGRGRPSPAVATPGVDRMMSDRLQQLRRFVNRRYVRAAFSGLSIGLIAIGFGACALELQHQVSYRAVFRYFARTHFQEADLTDLIKNPATTRSLEAALLVAIRRQSRGSRLCARRSPRVLSACDRESCFHQRGAAIQGGVLSPPGSGLSSP